MTNPNNIVRVRARNGGRASVYEANAWCQAFSSGIFEGVGVVQNTSADMNVLVGGSATKPDVLIAQNPSGYKIALDIIGHQAVAITAPTSNSRISAIVAYTDDLSLSTTQSDVTGSPSSCGLIVVNGTAAANPVAPTDTQIREAITQDGATGSQAPYCVIATIKVASNTTMITDSLISTNQAGIGSKNIDWSTMTCSAKCVLSAHITSNTSINGEAIIPLSTQEDIIGSGITINGSGQFVVGAGISHVLAFASWTCSAEATGFRRVHIRNNGTLTDGFAFTTTDVATGYYNGAVSGILLSVNEGDIIDLYNRDTKMTFWTGTRMSIIAY